MFDTITLCHQPENGAALDAGLIAEALLFYQNVTLALDYGSTTALIRQMGEETFFKFLESRFAHVTYSMDSPGTQTDTTNGISSHSLIFYSLAGAKGTKPKRGQLKETHIEGMLINAGANASAIKKYRRRFCENVTFQKHSELLGTPQDTAKAAMADLADRKFLWSAISSLLNQLAPSYEKTRKFDFEIFSNERNFYIATDLDFDAITKAAKLHLQDDAISITAPYLVQHILSAKVEMLLASKYGSGFLTSEKSRLISELKFQSLFSRLDTELKGVNLFQSKIVGGISDIRTAINSGERSFKDFLELYSNAARFKNWLKNINPDSDLYDEYVKEVTKEQWGDTLPNKSARFAFFTGAGISLEALFPTGIGTAMGLSLSFADTFVLDKLLAGWKPSIFISDVQDFVGK